MRSGLEGVVSTVPLSTGEPGAAGETRDARGRLWHWRFHASQPLHRFQGAWMRETPHGVMGVHGTWLNAPTAMWWDCSDAAHALEKALSPGARFDGLHGPLQGVRFEKRSIQLELHVDFARQHPLFVCEHECGLAFAHSIWRLVELMRTLGWPVEPDVKASALLVAHGAIVGARTLVQGVSKLLPGHTLRWSPQGSSVRSRVDLVSERHVLRDMTEAIELVDNAFMTSVESMVTTNQVHGCSQVNLLSGGLDSRLVLLASRKHAPDVRSLCFARTGSMDQTIAAEVASSQGTRHRFHSLGQGLHDVAGHGGRLRRHGEPFGFGPPQVRFGGLVLDGTWGAGVLAKPPTCLFTESAPRHLSEAFPLGPVPRALRSLALEATQEALASSPDAHVAMIWNRSFLLTNSVRTARGRGVCFGRRLPRSMWCGRHWPFIRRCWRIIGFI